MLIDTDVDSMPFSTDVSILEARVTSSRKLSVCFSCILCFHVRSMVISLILYMDQSSQPIILTSGRCLRPLLSQGDMIDGEGFIEMQDKASYQMKLPTMNRNALPWAIESDLRESSPKVLI